MKLTKGQIEALADETVEMLAKVDVIAIGPAKLKSEWEKLQELDKKVKAKEREVESAQEKVNKLEEEQESLERDFKSAKNSLEVKYGVKVKKSYVDQEDWEDGETVMKISQDLGTGIHGKIQRQITLLSIDENIDNLTADQLIDKIVKKNLKG